MNCGKNCIKDKYELKKVLRLLDTGPHLLWTTRPNGTILFSSSESCMAQMSVLWQSQTQI
jgi:hypothetical protein